MNIRGAAFIFIVAAITPSCSEKSVPERKQNFQKEAKPGPEAMALSGARSNEAEVERSSTSAVESTELEREEQQPPADVIGEDCVAFLRATKTIPGNGKNIDCPTCPVSPEGAEVLKFDDIQVNRVVPSGSNCEVNVTVRATFNPSTHETISGGLTAWISPEQKEKYLQGEAPSGQQVYKVKVIYRRGREGWRAVEFDRQGPNP
jgi:hypothetical protein